MAKINVGQLMIQIGLDSNGFNKQLKDVKNSIKGLEKELRNMNKDFGDVSNSITGLEKKQSLLNNVLQQSEKELSMHTKSRNELINRYSEEKTKLDELAVTHGKNSKEYLKQQTAIESTIKKIAKEENSISSLQNKIDKHKKSLQETNEQYYKLTNGVESYSEKINRISTTTQNMSTELSNQSKILYETGSKFQAYRTEAEAIATTLQGSIQKYQATREELSKVSTEYSKLLTTTEQHRQTLLKEQNTLETIKSTHGELSTEYLNQLNHVEQLTKKQIEYEQSVKSTQKTSQELKSTLTQQKQEVIENAKVMKEVGSTKLQQNLNYGSKVALNASQATQGISTASTALIGGASKIYMDYESGLAKVSTLLGHDKEQLQKIGNDIIRISNETGIASGQMMESAYQALSAGVDPSELNKTLAVSAKLATAGFTDQSNAMKLMTQVMNNYGKEAGNAEQIASKFMKTQNLGVTTVDEMSTSLSESLSLASTFGLNVDNVLASVVKMTKAGTSTSEAGTQISRMLEELGDTGSKVSGILQEKTGKSFTTLVQEGHSLFDILSIIQEYADATGVSMTELWGSSNAGIGALQILSSEGGMFNDVLKEIGNSSGLLDESFDKMANTDEFKMTKAINALKNSLIDLGKAFSPVIQGLASAIEGIAKGISGLSDGTKQFIGVLMGIGGALSPVLALLGKLLSFGSKLGGAGIFDSLFFGGKGTQAVKNTVSSLTGLKKEVTTIVAEGASEAVTKQAMDILNKSDKEISNMAKQQGMTIGTKMTEGMTEGLAQGAGEVVGEVAEVTGELAEGAIAGAEGMEALGSSATVATGALTSANAVALALVATIAVIATGTVLIGNKIQENATKHARAYEEMKNNIEQYKEEMKSLESEKSGIEDKLARYQELAEKTERTKEEQKEYNAILKEFADIDPSLVKYDENGNAIALEIDAVKRLIREYEKAIEKKKDLINTGSKDALKESFGKYEENQSKRDKAKEDMLASRTELLETYTSQFGFGKNNDWIEKLFNTDNFDVTAKSYFQKFQKAYDEEQKYMNSIIKQRKSVNKDAKEYMNSLFYDDNTFENASKNMQKAIKSAMKLDFSELGFEESKKAMDDWKQSLEGLSDEEVIQLNVDFSKVDELNKQFKNGEISAQQYSQMIDYAAASIADLTGFDKETVKKMITCPEFDVRSAEQTISDLENAKAKINEAIVDMASADNEGRMKIAMQLEQDDDLPAKVKETIAKAMADGIITDEEIKAIFSVVAEVDESDAKETLNEKIKDLGKEEEITKEVAVQYAMEVKNGADFNQYLEELTGSAKISKQIQLDISTNDLTGLTRDLANLPEEKQIGITIAAVNSGQYSIEQINTMLASLPPEVRSKVVASTEFKDWLKIQGLQEIDGKVYSATADVDSVKAEKKLNNLNNKKLEDKNAKADVDTSNANSKVDGINNKTLADKTFEIDAKNQTANQKIATTEGKKIKDKKFDINTDNKNAISKIASTDKKKIKDKKFQVNCTDKSTGILGSIISKLAGIVSKTITVTTRYATIGTPKNVPGVGTKSISQPEIVNPVGTQNIEAPQVLGSLSSLDAFNSKVSSTTQQINNNAKSLSDTADAIVSASAWKNGTQNISTTTSAVTDSLKYNVDTLKNMNELINKLSANFSRLDSIKDRTFGSRKTAIIQEEIGLLNQEQKTIVTNIANMEAMQRTLKNILSSKGFKFDSNGMISNYNSKLIAMQKNVEALKKKMDDYKGDNESTKNSLSKAYENANEALQLVNQELDKYLSLNSDIPNAKKQWEDLASSIQKAKNEIYEANKEQQNFNTDNQITVLNFQDKDIANQISSIDKQINMATTEAQNELLRDKIKLLQQQQQIQNKLYDKTAQQQQYDMAYLKKFGATFDELGNITNGVSFLNSNKTKDEYESIKKAYDAYNEAQHTTLPSITAQWEDLAGSIYDANKKIQENNDSAKELVKTFKEMSITAQTNQLNAQLSNLQSRLNNVDKILNQTYGSNKTRLIQKRIDLLKEENAKNKELYEFYKAQKGIDKNKLIAQYGVHFDDNGNIRDLQEQLNKLSTKEEKEALMDLANSFISNYENSEKFLSSIYEVNSEIQQSQNDITKLVREIDKLKDDSWVKKYTNDIEVLNNKLSYNNSLLELQGANTNELLNQNLDLYDQLVGETEKYIKYQEKIKKELSNTLITYGFKIDDDGTISNATEQLLKLKNTLSDDEFNNLQSDLDSYFTTTLETIPKLEKEILDYQKAQEDIENKKLETTKKVEDEITKVVKKQIEDRVKEIEKEKDARVKALNESKDAYNKWRDEVDYHEDYDEQLNKVKELEKQIEIAKRDNSLSGQKRVADLMTELKDEQKNLEKLVQDKIDKDVNTMFDDQITSIEDTAEDRIQNLEDTWTDAKIAELIKKSLQTGLFEDIDGNIQDLNGTLMEFADSSADYLGVMGDSLKTELLDNLDVALATMAQLNQTATEMSKIDYRNLKFGMEGYTKEMLQGNVTTNNNTTTLNVDFNPTYNFEGNGSIDEEAVQKLINQSKDDISNTVLQTIVKNMN